MSKGIDIYMQHLRSKDDSERYTALQEMLKITEDKVPWFDQYKDELIEKLHDSNSYQRSIGMMLLCNLAQNNDSNKEYRKILETLLPMINDEKFITQRQYIQNIWKVALADSKYKNKIVKQLQNEFIECTKKKHYNLLRLDIVTSLKNIMKGTNDLKMNDIINELIEKEEDQKNRKALLKIIEV